MDKKEIEKIVNGFETSITPFQEIAEKWSYGDFALFFDGICSKNIYGFEKLLKPIFNYNLSDDKVFLMIEKYPSIFKELPQKFLTEATYREYISSAKSKNVLESAIRQNGNYKFTPQCARIALDAATEPAEYEALINKIKIVSETDNSKKEFEMILKEITILNQYLTGQTKLADIEKMSFLIVDKLFVTKLVEISRKKMLDYVEKITKNLSNIDNIKNSLLTKVEDKLTDITERLQAISQKHLKETEKKTSKSLDEIL